MSSLVAMRNNTMLALDTIVAGLKVAVETVRDVTAELRVSEGQSH